MIRNTIVLLTLLLGLVPRAWALLDIEITEGVEGEQPIAIVPFDWAGPGAPPEVDVAGIVASDLRRTGKFKLIPKEKFKEFPHHGGEVNFEHWRALGVESLLVGRVRAAANDQYTVQFQLFDIYKHGLGSQKGPQEQEYRIKQLTGYNLTTRREDMRRTAHYVSDIVYEALTGERGAFTTKIAYITVTGPVRSREYTLQIADIDGYNPYTVLRSREPILSPAWSPDGRRLAYVSFEKERSQIYVQELASGKRELVSSQKGVNGAPAWSPDGRRMALSLSRDGNLEIYILDMATQQLQRLTNNTAIDTEPVWSPDGNSIVFVSDRSGSPQLYSMSSQGGRATRVSFQGNYNARPSFAPDGKSLVMVHATADGFHIATLELATGVVQLLTRGRLDESPSFAPNGSMILFATTEKNRGQLEAVSRNGNVRQRLILQQGDVREPAWGPFIR